MNEKNETAKIIKMLLFLMMMVIAVFALILILDVDKRSIWLRENGVIETLSAIGYLVCALYIAYLGKLPYLKTYNYFFLMIVLFGLRELDFDKRFTTMGVFKSKFYISSEVPVAEKIIGLMVISLVLYVLFSIVKKHSKGFLANLKMFEPVYTGSFVVIMLLLVSKTFDGFARKLRDFGVEISESASNNFSALEEVLELAIPIALLITFYAYFSRQKAR